MRLSILAILTLLLPAAASRAQSIFDKPTGVSSAPVSPPPAPAVPATRPAAVPIAAQPGASALSLVPHALAARPSPYGAAQVFELLNSSASRPVKPVPDAGAILAANRALEASFGADLVAAKTPEQKRLLVQKLFEAAEAAAGAQLYCLLTKAKSVAIETADIGDADYAMNAIESQFAADAFRERLDAYSLLVRGGPAVDDRDRLFGDLLSVERAAIITWHRDAAKTAADLAMRLARRLNDADLQKRAADDERLARAVQDSAPTVDKARSELAGRPGDPAASQVVGRYYCFLCEDWRTGIPMLARSPDDAVRALAVGELGQPRQAAARVTLADGWWDLSGTLGEVEKANVRRHAAGLYEAATDQLAGSARLRAQARIADTFGQNGRAGATTQPSLDSVVVEALINGNSELHIEAAGIHWEEHGSSRVGAVGGTSNPTYINGKPWWPEWGNPIAARGDDRSESIPVSVGKPDLGYEIIAIAAQRGGKGIAQTDPVTIRKTPDGSVITIPNADGMQRWYGLRIWTIVTTEHPVRCVGKWQDPGLGQEVVLNSDGSVTASRGNAQGTWAATSDGSQVQIKWQGSDWIDVYTRKGAAWTKNSYQSGIKRVTGSVSPP